MFLDRYNNAASRNDKMAIVDQVLHIIRKACPVGAFVKFENGRYYEIDDRSAREKVGAHFRDCLAEQYKSSAKNKIAKRKERKERRRMSMASTSCAGSVCTSSTAPCSEAEDYEDFANSMMTMDESSTSLM